MKKGPKCPRCKSTASVVESGDRNYWCNDCKCLFDDDPNEGGDYSDINPAVRLERQERNKPPQRRRR